MLNFSEIPVLHDQLTAAWHREAFEVWQPSQNDWTNLISRQHLANFELWHTEDEARTPGATDSDLARVKRRIDSTNQRRNDLSEQIDQLLLEKLTTVGMPNKASPLHSESPGLMIDRLSILALKLYHTREEMERPDAPQGHFERNESRLATLTVQRDDLSACLVRLWEEALSGTRRFKLYRQLKMYNDPSLNPSVYRNSQDH